MEDLLKVGDRFGMTAVVLVALAIFLWRVLTWLKPWAEKMFAAHLSLIQTLTATQTKHEDTLQKLAVNQEQQTHVLRELKETALSNSQLLIQLHSSPKANHG